MQLPPHQSIRIRRTAAGEDADAWAATLATLDHEPTLTELKQTETSAVWRAEPFVAGRRVPIVAKVHQISGLGGKAKLAAGHSKGKRQWKGSAWLAANGFGTAMPLALATGQNEHGDCECLCIEALAGWTVLDYLASLGPDAERGLDTDAEQHADETVDDNLLRGIAAAAGDGIGRMVAKKRFNRDHKPSNLVVVDEAEPRIAIIDTVAIRPAGSDSRLDLVAMLKSLVLEPKGLGFEPPRWWLEAACASALSALGLASDGAELADAVEYAVEIHGNPRPEDVPIMRSSGRASEAADDDPLDDLLDVPKDDQIGSGGASAR